MLFVFLVRESRSGVRYCSAHSEIRRSVRRVSTDTRKTFRVSGWRSKIDKSSQPGPRPTIRRQDCRRGGRDGRNTNGFEWNTCKPNRSRDEPADWNSSAGLQTAKLSPFDKVEWERRTALIGNDKGQVIFRQENVEVPKSWSQTATNIVASKYFHGKPNTPERETSVRQLIGRVVDTIVRWGEEGGYFATAESQDAFRDELTHLLVEQKMAFNSPVWFNVGVQAKPQCSACFINSVQDNMESIMNLAKTEGMLFKWGSGTGTNFSSLRGSHESLSGGGIASGPVSFMKGFDAFAGVIKSGGKTRRAAKMVILNVDHPDIVEFIESQDEGRAQGARPDRAGIRSCDRRRSLFLRLLSEREPFRARYRRIHARRRRRPRLVDAQRERRQARREVPRARSDAEMAESAWQCGDPGMQYDTTINRWHTCKATDRIYASNPCSEYMFLDDTACNLASLESAEVPRRERPIRYRRIPPRGGRDHHRAGNSGG